VGTRRPERCFCLRCEPHRKAKTARPGPVAFSVRKMTEGRVLFHIFKRKQTA